MEAIEIKIECVKIIISILTPIIILCLGVKINKNFEKNKLDILKEKEWQVRWADLFFESAIRFNNSISKIVCLLNDIQKINSQSSKYNDIINELNLNISIIENENWHIQNFTQFSSVSGDKVMEKQKILFEKISALIKNNKGNFEEIRKIQFEYNKAVKITHNEILKIKS